MSSAIHTSILSSVLLSAVVCCAASAQTPAESKVDQDRASSQQQSKDARDQLLETANATNTFLAKACRLALDKSTNAEVKQLASQILRDHALGYRGAGMDRTAATVLDEAMTTKQMTMLTQLENAKENFDRLYVDQMVSTIRAALVNSQKYTGTNELLRKSIADAIAADKENLKIAEQLQARMHGEK